MSDYVVEFFPVHRIEQIFSICHCRRNLENSIAAVLSWSEKAADLQSGSYDQL